MMCEGQASSAWPFCRLSFRLTEWQPNGNMRMIQGFSDRDTERLFQDQPVRRFSAIERQARRKLLLLDAASRLDDLRVPPGNRLEALVGDRAGQHSIRINRQWRICFRWRDGDADDVEIVDYH